MRKMGSVGGNCRAWRDKGTSAVHRGAGGQAGSIFGS